MDGTQARSIVPSYLAWSIVNTLCCCLPLGIAAIVFSSRVSDANSAGDVTRAQESSRMAKKLNIAATVIGVILIIVIIVLQVTAKNSQH